MKINRLLLLLIVLLPSIGRSAESKWTKKLWRASFSSMVAASAADVVTSRNRYELNPILRSSSGSIGTQGIALKVGINVAIVLVPRLVLRHHMNSADKVGAFINFASAGAVGFTAWHNSTVPTMNSK